MMDNETASHLRTLTAHVRRISGTSDPESWWFVAAMTDEPKLRQAFLEKAMGVVDDE